MFDVDSTSMLFAKLQKDYFMKKAFFLCIFKNLLGHQFFCLWTNSNTLFSSLSHVKNILTRPIMYYEVGMQRFF